MLIRIPCFHTQKRKEPEKILLAPIPGEGVDQWLGDGFYFWQDYEFAKWWGETKKCGRDNITGKYDIYKVEIYIEESDFIDTVFNEEDYTNFVRTIDDFASRYMKKYKVRPTLEEFNDFISDFNVWEGIEAIRFQDVPENNKLVNVTGFFYKKRIQIRVNNPELISKFDHFKKFLCV